MSGFWCSSFRDDQLKLISFWNILSSFIAKDLPLYSSKDCVGTKLTFKDAHWLWWFLQCIMSKWILFCVRSYSIKISVVEISMIDCKRQSCHNLVPTPSLLLYVLLYKRIFPFWWPIARASMSPEYTVDVAADLLCRNCTSVKLKDSCFKHLPNSYLPLAWEQCVHVS